MPSGFVRFVMPANNFLPIRRTSPPSIVPGSFTNSSPRNLPSASANDAASLRRKSVHHNRRIFNEHRIRQFRLGRQGNHPRPQFLQQRLVRPMLFLRFFKINRLPLDVAQFAALQRRTHFSRDRRQHRRSNLADPPQCRNSPRPAPFAFRVVATPKCVYTLRPNSWRFCPCRVEESHSSPSLWLCCLPRPAPLPTLRNKKRPPWTKCFPI